MVPARRRRHRGFLIAKLSAFLNGVAGIVASSLVLVLLGLVYFIVTAWIVAFGVETVLGAPPSADFVALSAALLSLGSLAGSSYSAGSFTPDEPDEGEYGAEVA